MTGGGVTADPSPANPASTNAAPLNQPRGGWRGETYYGRQQLKPWPFNPYAVGAYVFLAGLSGASAIIGALAGLSPRRAARWPLVRRSRYLSMLAPTIGSALLVWDLHSPKRFYNMLRVAKARSPMSVGTWTLVGFGGFAGVSAAAQALADLKPGWRWPGRVAFAAQMPAAVAGAGLGTYTAALIASTSAPGWAAAPRPTGVRFRRLFRRLGGGAAPPDGETTGDAALADTLLLAALTAEIVAAVAIDARYKATGIEEGLRGPWRSAERIGATGLGSLLPFGLLLAARHLAPRPLPAG